MKTEKDKISLSEEEETSRVLPVIKEIKKQFKDAVISVDQIEAGDRVAETFCGIPRIAETNIHIGHHLG
jgi:dihydropteroate synthase